MTTLTTWLKEQQIELQEWQLNAAHCFLKHLDPYRTPESGKTFLIETIAGFINDHGSDFALECFLELGEPEPGMVVITPFEAYQHAFREQVFFGSLEEWMTADTSARRKAEPVYLLPTDETYYSDDGAFANVYSILTVSQVVGEYIYRLRIIVGKCLQPGNDEEYQKQRKRLDAFTPYMEGLLVEKGYTVIRGIYGYSWDNCATKGHKDH